MVGSSAQDRKPAQTPSPRRLWASGRERGRDVCVAGASELRGRRRLSEPRRVGHHCGGAEGAVPQRHAGELQALDVPG